MALARSALDELTVTATSCSSASDMRQKPANHATVAWWEVLRALREAHGVTQAGWAAWLGVSSRTLQRWESGVAAPDAGAERQLVAVCQAKGLFRSYDRGVVRGLVLTPDSLRDLLAAARVEVAQLPERRRFVGFDHETDAAVVPTGRLSPASVAATSLPAPLTRFIGRERETTSLMDLLRSTRLLTLTGPGGVGKTRLALHVVANSAEQYADGVWFVSLAPIEEADHVVPRIAQTLGVGEVAGQLRIDRLVTALRARELLLVLDNFEHLLAAASDCAELLQACPRLKILVTSRAPLRVSGEQQFAVRPLPLPDARQERLFSTVGACPSVALFVDRASAVVPDFCLTEDNVGDIVDICARLDGLPLAIELAAARLKVFRPRGLLDRLDRRLALLTGGARDQPQRHQTLRATILWSTELLSQPERQVFRALGVFAGGFTLEAVQSVCGVTDDWTTGILDILTSLVDKSLVQLGAGSGGEPRFGLLDTIREFCLDEVRASGEEARLRQRHARFFLDLAERAASPPQRPAWRTWQGRLTAEQDNLRTALRWAIDHGDAALGMNLVGALWWYFERTSPAEGHRWAEELLALPDSDVPGSARAKALMTSGELAMLLGDGKVARARLGECITLARTSGERWYLGIALGALGRATRADLPVSRTLGEESVAVLRSECEPWGLALVLNALGGTRTLMGEVESGQAAFEEALRLASQTGDIWQVGLVQFNLGRLAFLRDHDDLAHGHLSEAVETLRAAEDRWYTAQAMTMLGWLAYRAGDPQQADTHFTQSLAVSRDLGDSLSMAEALEGQAGVAALRQEPHTAAQLLGAAHGLAGDREHAGLFSRRVYEQVVESVRTALGDDAFARAWAAGERLPIENLFAETTAHT